MAKTLRLVAFAAASTVAIVAGSALSLAQEKERIGIDNVDRCDAAVYDPNCNDDAMETATQNFAHNIEVKQFGSIESEASVEDEAGTADTE